MDGYGIFAPDTPMSVSHGHLKGAATGEVSGEFCHSADHALLDTWNDLHCSHGGVAR